MALAVLCIAVRVPNRGEGSLRLRVSMMPCLFPLQSCPPPSRKDEEKQIDQLLHVQSSENETIQDSRPAGRVLGSTHDVNHKNRSNNAEAI